LPVIPPVEVAAARLPCRSRATTPNAASLEFVLQFAPAPFTVKIASFRKNDALLPAKGERTLSDQQYFFRSFHDRTRGQYRIARPEDARDRTRPMVATVHQRGVHLLRPGGCKDAASAGIEQRVVLEHHDRFSDRVESAAARGKNFTTGCQGSLQTLMVLRRNTRRGRILPRDGSGAAMHGKRKAWLAGLG
jgi:hypothetical protein